MQLTFKPTKVLGLLAVLTSAVVMPVSSGHSEPASRAVTSTAAAHVATAKASVVQQAVAAHAAPAAWHARPDFATYSTTYQRKQAFYSYLLPKIREVNEAVAGQRSWLEQVAGRLVDGHRLAEREVARLARMERQYGVKSPANATASRIKELLLRVDVVPASLVLAQAAKESGWGTSRFAVQGNNYFGIWCFYHGCGITPARRDEGRTHEVATFDSVAAGVRYYIINLNSQSAYRKMWQIRATARSERQFADGAELARGLVRYSERGIAYVREIQNMIRYNKLHRFTRPPQEA